MDNFWKPFFTLFGIGAAVSFAKSLKNKKSISEMASEMILSGFFACAAAGIMIVYPTVNFIAVAGIASLGTILGISFLSDAIQNILVSRFGKKDDNGPKL